MVAVHTFVIFIKEFFNMIDKRKFKNINGGEIPFGLEVLLFVIAIFVIWIFMGGAKKPAEQRPFITPLSDQINPGMKYGPNDINN